MTVFPERSKRLQALLGLLRLCSNTRDAVNGECDHDARRRYSSAGQASLALGHAVWLDGDLGYATDSAQSLNQVSGSLGVRWLDPLPVSTTLQASTLALVANGTHDAYYERAGARLSFDARWAPAFDLLLAYEPGVLREGGNGQLRPFHALEADLAWVLGSGVQWVWSSQAQLGQDVNAVYLGALLRVRPR